MPELTLKFRWSDIDWEIEKGGTGGSHEDGSTETLSDNIIINSFKRNGQEMIHCLYPDEIQELCEEIKERHFK